MHLYVAARGILRNINEWENNISSKYFPFELSDKNAKLIGGKIGMVQTSIRPIRLYEIVVPEPQMPSLLRMIQPTPPWNRAYNKFVFMVRKALKLEKIYTKNIPKRISSDAHCFDGVQVTAIGTKKDKYVDGQEQL